MVDDRFRTCVTHLPRIRGWRTTRKNGTLLSLYHPRMTSCLRLRSSLAAFRLATVGLAFAGAVRAAEPFEAFLEAHCIRCHGPEKEKGDLRIDELSRDFKLGADTHHWAEVIEQVNSGEMPPEDEKRPTQQEIAAFVTSLDAFIKEGRAARMAARPAVAHYRLSRKEYQNTVYDLLGVRYDPAKPGELNEDTLWHGFERIGSELSLSPSHVDRYYRAAELVIDRAFPVTSGEARKVRKTAADLRYGGGKDQQAVLDRFGIKRPLRYLLFPGNVQNALSPNWFGKTGPEHSGLYKVRIQASGIRPPGGQTAHLSIGKRTGEETVDGLIEFDLTAPEDSPQVHEFEVFLEMPMSLDFCVVATDVVDRRQGAAFRGALGSRGYIFTHSSETYLLNPNAPQMFDDKGNGLFSTVLLDWIEWEGPLETESEKARRKGLLPPDDAPPEVVSEHLHRFAERAWRRPVKMEELEQYLKSYRDERDAGESAADAYRLAMQGVLTSRHFLYLVEGDTVARERLTDAELASRLSYFLWSSMPDDALFTAVKGGTLSGDGLGKEVDRMLSDSKASRFIDDFSRQWLQLHRVGMFPPDKKLYPAYDAWLEESMRAEPVEFFREMFSKNVPIDGFIEADWTMANARLCDFYGLPEPKSGGFQRVSLKPEDRRGGLLTMGAVLGLTSDGTRHRPVHRGVWLSEVILGKTPPPPPANVPAIEPNPPTDPKATLRDKLAAHAKDVNCAACHAKIDPLGLAWDNYDAIGQWRTHEKVAAGVGEDPVVNPAGEMPDGRAFKDANDFKRLLIEDRDKVALAFIEHLCTYGLRRVLTVDDQEDLKAIEAEAKKNGYGIRDIVRAVAMSELMRKR
jgi:mono/diheme cytochrome c family protein